MREAIMVTALAVIFPVVAMAYDEPSWPEVAAGHGQSHDRYVSAVVSAAEYANRRQLEAGRAPVFCAPPGGISVPMLMDATRAWVERNPGYRVFPAPHVLFGTLHDTYPCPTS